MALILIVDDYPVTQRLIGQILQNNGHESVIANNGVEALEMLEAESFDLLIVDIAMPEMDGITLLRHLRADVRFAALPVIMLTASGQDEDRIDAEAAGADDFLTKPASSHQLIETVNRHLR
jgi:two-component system, chemotaxis family, chemotaxis protein CheY